MTLQMRQDVSLVALNQNHAEAMYRWMLDPTVSQNLGLRSQPSSERTRQWIERALADPNMNPYAVLLEGQHVGNVILDMLDTYLLSMRLSVYIGETQARGAGVGSTAVYLALREGFQQHYLNKVWLTVHVCNMAAIKAYLRLGFQLEGILRDEFILNGERIPTLYLGILSRDFALLDINWLES